MRARKQWQTAKELEKRGAKKKAAAAAVRRRRDATAWAAAAARRGGVGGGGGAETRGPATHPIVLSLYFSKELVTKRSTIELLPTPVSPSSTTLTSRGVCRERGGGARAVGGHPLCRRGAAAGV